jgi:hypothetical protein
MLEGFACTVQTDSRCALDICFPPLILTICQCPLPMRIQFFAPETCEKLSYLEQRLTCMHLMQQAPSLPNPFSYTFVIQVANYASHWEIIKHKLLDISTTVQQLVM